MRYFHCLLKHSNINIAQNFGHVQKRLYRTGIYNLQTRTSTFPDKGKLLEKLNLRYFKKLKNIKLNTKDPQIKHFPSSKFGIIYRPDLYNLQTRKKVTKNCN